MEVTDVLGTVGMLLPIFVQKLRAKKSFPEWGALLIVGAIGVTCYWLVGDGNPLTKEFWQGAVGWVLMAMGVNQGASMAANSGLAAIPRTNSQ
jgi:hypothetical protein